MKIGFYVRSKIKGQPATVYLRFVEKGQVDIWIPTTEKVYPEYWNGKKGKLFNTNKAYTISFTEKMRIEIEGRLLALRQQLTSDAVQLRGELTKEWLKKRIDKFYGKSSDGDALNDYIDAFIKKAETGGLKNKQSKDFVPGTVRKLKGFQRVFNMYQGIYTEKDRIAILEEEKSLRPLKVVDYNDINTDFYNSFVAWLSSEGYKVNTIGRFVKELKYFMHKALVDKKHNNREFEEFTVSTEESHAIYLTLDEVEQIYRAKIADPRVEIARDCFVVLCETALRISDYKQIDVSLQGNFIHIYQQKTGTKVIIPQTLRMKEILKKYSGKLPYIHENYVNSLIKNVAFQVGLKDGVSWVTTKRGKKETVFSPKWKLVSCHTGRRSAATNMYKAGLPILDIMKITGHKTERSFLKYIKLSQEETAERLALHPFFNTLRVAK